MFFGSYLSPTVTAEDWSITYGIEPKLEECRCCGKELSVNKPFATKEVRGFISGPCECGNEKTPFTFVFKDEVPQIPTAQLSLQN